MVRPPCSEKISVKRGVWSAEEDAKILAFVSKHGSGNWTSITKKAGLKRCGKSCRLRWTNYLRPDLKHDNFTPQEEELVIKLHAAIGSRWSIIAQQLPGRTDSDVKNHWNTKLKKKLSQMGIDPVTHKPFSKLIADYGNIGGNSHYRPSTNRINNGSINKDFKNIAILSKSEPYQTLPQGSIKSNNSQPKESPASSPPKLEPNENNFSDPSIVTTTTIMPCPTMCDQLNGLDKFTVSSHTSIVTGATNCIDMENIENYETIPSSPILVEGCLSTSSSPSYSSACSTAAQEALPAPFSWNDFLLEDAFAPNNNVGYYNHDEQEEVVADFLSKDLVNHIENVTRLSLNKKEVIRSQQGTSISSDFLFSPSSSSSEISFVEAMLDQENEMFLSFPHLMEEPPNF